MTKSHLNSSITAAAIAFACLAPVSVARAQTAATGPRWQGWLGCWTTAPAATSLTDAAIVCITPTADNDIVELSAIANKRILSRDRVDASGRSLVIDANGCKGTARSTWSGDKRRVYLTSSVTCGGLPSEISALLVMAPTGEWLDVRKTSAGGGSAVRVARYRDVGIPNVVPNEIADALIGRNLEIQSARHIAGLPVDTRAIIEASHATDSAIVVAWIYESGQSFEMTPAAMRQLADAGVPGTVRDAMSDVSGTRANGGWRYGRFGRDNAGWARYDPWAYGYYRPFTYDGYADYLRGYVTNGFEYAGLGFGMPSFEYGFPPIGISLKPSVVGYVYPQALVLHSGSLASTDLAANGKAGKGQGADAQRPGVAANQAAAAKVAAAAAALAAAAANANDSPKTAPNNTGKTTTSRQ